MARYDDRSTGPGERLPGWLARELGPEAKIRTLNKGEILFRLGAPVTHIYFVLEGEIRAVRYLADGTPCVMQRGGEGEIFGSPALCVDRYSCEATACCPTRVVEIPSETLRVAAVENGELALRFALSLAEDMRRQCSRYERLRLKSAGDRILHYLACEADETGRVVLRSSVMEWAAELGLEAATLYRTLSKLERDGVLRREGKRVVALC